MPDNLEQSGPPTLPVGRTAPPVVAGPLPTLKGPDGLAIASLVCGILSLATFCMWCVSLPLGIAGLTCAYVSRDRSALRTAGMVCSIIGTVLGLLFTALYIVSSVMEATF